MSILGIDFGTTNTSASYINSFGEAEAIRFIGQDIKIPSVVSFYNPNTIMYGYEAMYMIHHVYQLPQKEQVKLFASTIQSIKRKLQDKGTFCGYHHGDIVAMLIKHIREQAEKACAPTRFDSLVLTHPVQFEEWKKRLLKDAAWQAGFKQVELLEEPVAAAMGYSNSRNEAVKGLLVYDLGGGTFDVAYVTRQEDKFVVPLPPQGFCDCGGDDIDQALYNFIAKKATLFTQDDYQAERDLGLYFNCRRWKEMLSAMESLPITVVSKKASGSIFEYRLKRSELEDLAAGLVDKTIRMTKCVYDEVKENRLPLDYILLIGGSSRIPMIQTKLKESLPGVEIRTSGQDDIAVALGASYHAVKPVVIDPENEWCYCMYDGKKILKTYNFCIYCGKPNYFKTGKF